MRLHRIEYEYPLRWPANFPRTTDREISLFYQKSVAEARDLLARELARWNAWEVQISSNAPLLRNGMMKSEQPKAGDPGVAVYFELDGKNMVIPSDKWVLLSDNVHAVTKTLDALRGIQRWGTKAMMEAMFSGYKALPEQASGDAWWWTLGADPHASREEVKALYRKLGKQHHPDLGGDPDEWRDIQEAYEEAMRILA